MKLFPDPKDLLSTVTVERFEKFGLTFSISLFVIHVNLFQP